MINPITLSVRLMTYNHAEYITQCLIGIEQQQTSFPFEVIIGDDFSTDNNLTLIQQFITSSTNKSINYILLNRKKGDEYDINRQKKGRLYNFLDIIHHCKGKYIALLDGDDYWTDPLKLQKQVDFLEENEEYVACFTGCKHVDESNKIIKESRYESYYDQTAEQLLTAEGAMITNSVMFRNVIKVFPPSFYQIPSGDTFLYHLLGFHGGGKFIPTIEYSAYRIHSGGVWSGINDLQRMKNTLCTMSAIKENLVLHFGKENDYIKKMNISTFNNIKGYLYLSLYHKRFRMYFSMHKLIFTQKSFNKTFLLQQHLLDLFQRLFKIK